MPKMLSCFAKWLNELFNYCIFFQPLNLIYLLTTEKAYYFTDRSEKYTERDL